MQIHKATAEKLGISPDNNGFYSAPASKNIRMEDHNIIIANIQQELKVYWMNRSESIKEENRLLKETLDGVSSLLDFAINATPTGAVRNLLCDANIKAKEALNNK